MAPLRKKNILPDWRTLVSAVLIVASFPPWDFRWLIFFALTPWLAALLRRPNWKTAAIQGIWLSVFMTIFGFSWIAYVLKQFGNLPMPVAALGLVIYSFVGQIQFILFAPFYAWLRGRMGRPWDSLIRTACLALLYTGIDALVPKLFRDTLGHSLYTAPWLRQAADLGGAHLLTFAIFWVNDTLFGLYRELKYHSKNEPSLWPAITAALPSLAASLSFCAVLSVYGSWRQAEIQALIAHPKTQVRGAIIQANIGDFDKLASEGGLRSASEKVISTYTSLSDQAVSLEPKPDFLVWPETAYPSTFRTPMTSDDLVRDQQVEAFVRSRKVPLLFGGYDRAMGKDYNAFFFLSPEGEAGTDLQVYRKNILLLFGEYIPWTEHNPLLQKYFPQIANFGRGAGPSVLQVPMPSGRPPLVLNPIICYEAIFPQYVIDGARKGGQMLMNITNDSWFGPWGEAELHLSLSVFSSIETRLPMLRGTNTGISALILPDGSISQKTGTFRQEIMNVEIPLIDSPQTWLKKFGDWFGLFALITGVVGLTGLHLYRKKRATQT